MKNLKSLLVLTAAFVLSFSMANGQIDKTTISESENVMSKGSQHSFSFTLSSTDEKTVQRVYRDHLRSEYGERPKHNRRDAEWVATDISVVGIDATRALNIYARFNEAGGDVAVNVWFELGDEFISTEKFPEKKEGIYEFIRKVRLEIRKSVTENLLSDLESELNSLERQLKSLVRDKEGYEKDIRDAEQEIQEARANIEKNLRDQVDAKTAVERQKEKIHEVQRKLKELN